MGALYPTEPDRFKRYATGDDLVAAELSTMFDALVSMETELGTDPSGDFATLSDRIFSNGNVERATGKWGLLYWGIWVAAQSQTFYYEGPGEAYTWFAGQFDGKVKTEYGDGIPGFFAQLQIDVNATTGDYAAKPWPINAISHEDGALKLIGQDAYLNELSTSNTKANVRVGVIYWGMFT